MSIQKRELKFNLGFSDELALVQYVPKNASAWGARMLFEGVPPELKLHARTLMDQGYAFYACDQMAGWCNDRAKMIIIPMYVIDPSHQYFRAQKVGYKTYYIAHEMAHAFAGCRNQHNQVFMEELKRLCPQEFLHWELEYKPRNATTAGITAPTLQTPWSSKE